MGSKLPVQHVRARCQLERVSAGPTAARIAGGPGVRGRWLRSSQSPLGYAVRGSSGAWWRCPLKLQRQGERSGRRKRQRSVRNPSQAPARAGFLPLPRPLLEPVSVTATNCRATRALWPAGALSRSSSPTCGALGTCPAPPQADRGTLEQSFERRAGAPRCSPTPLPRPPRGINTGGDSLLDADEFDAASSTSGTALQRH